MYRHLFHTHGAPGIMERRLPVQTAKVRFGIRRWGPQTLHWRGTCDPGGGGHEWPQRVNEGGSETAAKNTANNGVERSLVKGFADGLQFSKRSFVRKQHAPETPPWRSSGVHFLSRSQTTNTQHPRPAMSGTRSTPVMRS